MSLISIRLSDELLQELDMRAQQLKIPRTEYIRRAIEIMNKQHDEELLRGQLMEVSKRVRASSMAINKEFDQLEDDSET